MSKINKTFLDIEKKDPDAARIIIVPFGFEATTTFGKGAKNGPEAIIKASAQVELFDEELWQEIYKKVSIATLGAPRPAEEIAEAKKQIQKIIHNLIENKKFPIILGGEHSTTPFIIEEFKNHYSDFSILQFDAHADLRDGYLGEKYSHASAMRRSLDYEKLNLVQIGVRNISNENNELIFWQNNQKRIRTFWAKDKKSWKIGEILKNLKQNVYITFDVDVLDSSLMPSTGTPEPGGLGWYEVLEILRSVSKNRKIIGADFVELSPVNNLSAPDFLVAKLIYKFIGYLHN